MANVIKPTDLDYIFNELLGQSYTESLEDEGGCSMGRSNSTWMSPHLICRIVQEVVSLCDCELEAVTPKEAA